MAQLGTSGSGNHFVELGVLESWTKTTQLGLQPGKYLALLSHSGSRGMGFQIADHYSKLAKHLHPELRRKRRHLALAARWTAEAARNTGWRWTWPADSPRPTTT